MKDLEVNINSIVRRGYVQQKSAYIFCANTRDYKFTNIASQITI